MTPLDTATALLWTQRILGCGLLIQSAELFVARGIYAKSGALAGRGNMLFLLGARGLIALWLLGAPTGFNPQVSATILAALLISSAWLTVRSRGPVCGGSDSMYFQVQLGLFVAALGYINPLLVKLGLGWIAAQSVLSYFLAGVGKIRNAGWRDGTALQQLFASNGPYVLLHGIRRLASAKMLCAGLGWSVVLFELGFPMVLALPTAGKTIFLGLALFFHLTNAVVLGLNRFIWAWAATYPALLHFH